MNDVTKEVSEYMSKIGRKGGQKNKEKGSEYFSRISKMRKFPGRKPKKV